MKRKRHAKKHPIKRKRHRARTKKHKRTTKRRAHKTKKARKRRKKRGYIGSALHKYNLARKRGKHKRKKRKKGRVSRRAAAAYAASLGRGYHLGPSEETLRHRAEYFERLRAKLAAGKKHSLPLPG